LEKSNGRLAGRLSTSMTSLEVQTDVLNNRPTYYKKNNMKVYRPLTSGDRGMEEKY